MWKLAWRNLWRNKRRTIITTASIVFAVIIAIVTRSFQIGTYNNMLNGIVEQFSGHIQIQQRDYFRNPTIDNSLKYDNKIKSILDNNPDVTVYVPRIQTGVLTSSGQISKVAFIVGCDVEKEKSYSLLDKKIARYKIDDNVINKLKTVIDSNGIKTLEQHKGYYRDVDNIKNTLLADNKNLDKYIDTIAGLSKFNGRYLHKNENGVLVGSKLAEYLNLTVGDSIIIIGQGYHGTTAIGKYPIVGLLHFPNPQFNATMIYMPLSTAQDLFSLYDDNDTTGYISYISVNTIYPASIRPVDYKGIEKVITDLKQQINDKDIRVVGWKDLNKVLDQQISMDNISGQIMLYILYLIIGFSVFGTIMMMIAERRKEFGVMLAIGMQRKKIKAMLMDEILMMTAMGIILGILITIPIILYGYHHPLRLGGQYADVYAMFNIEPIMPMAWFGSYMITQPLIVLVIIMLTALYPRWYIRRLKVSNALRA